MQVDLTTQEIGLIMQLPKIQVAMSAEQMPAYLKILSGLLDKLQTKELETPVKPDSE